PVAARRAVHQGGQRRLEQVRQRRAGFLRAGLGLGRRGGRPALLGRNGRLAEHALRAFVDDAVFLGGTGHGVAFLDQQPLLLVAAARQVGAYQGPVAAELLALQAELEFAAPVALVRVAVGLPDAPVPDNHVARA